MSNIIQPPETLPKTGDLGSEWAARWRAGRTGFHQPDINAQLVQHWPKLVPNEKASVVVPLCGKSRDMRWLHQRGHQVVGIELVEPACRAFFDEQGLSYERTQESSHVRFRGCGEAEGLTVLCGDIFEIGPTDIGPVHAWYDRAAIVALPPALWGRYASWVSALLPAHAVGFMLTFDYPQAERNGPPFSVGISDVEAHFSDGFEMELLEQLDLTAENRWNLSRIHKPVLSLRRR
jgi:thiopurine S-methyltransferase